MRHFTCLPVLTALIASSASAHITLERQEAAVGASYKAVFRVGTAAARRHPQGPRAHPDGVINVKPMPKPGWQVETVKGKYDKAYTMFHSGTVTEGVKEIAWTGRLPDESTTSSCFGIPHRRPRARPARSTSRSCRSARAACIAGSRSRQEGKPAADYKEPAPGVKLLPKK